MKKILRIALTSVIACITAVAISLCAYAETEDVELPLTKAKMTNGSWGQSITLDKNDFDCSRITPESIVYVEFELGLEWDYNRAPVELVLFNYTTADPQIWAKVEPYEWDTESASFDYESMVAMYGSDDFSTVDHFIIGDTGIAMKVTKFTVSNCTVVEETTVSETEEEVTETEPTEAETTTTAATTEATTTAATTAAAQTESGEDGGITGILIVVVIAAVVIAGVIVTLIVVKKNKNRFY